MHAQYTQCSFNPVWLCPKLFGQEQKTGRSAGTPFPDKLHQALTRAP
jgi:hypothetical protein